MPDSVDPDYRHRPKQARSAPALPFGAVVLKWFDLDEPDFPIMADTRAAARASIATRTPDPADRAGFVILHRCGPSFHFLLTCLWRGNNELWQAVHYIDAATPAFAAFPPAYPAPDAARPTFCVWELGVVAREAQAWQTYLSSPRTPADFDRWLHDIRQGPV